MIVRLTYEFVGFKNYTTQFHIATHTVFVSPMSIHKSRIGFLMSFSLVESCSVSLHVANNIFPPSLSRFLGSYPADHLVAILADFVAFT